MCSLHWIYLIERIRFKYSSHESEQLSICVVAISIWTLFLRFFWEFGTMQVEWYFVVFSFFWFANQFKKDHSFSLCCFLVLIYIYIFNRQRTWWRLLQKSVVGTTCNIYVFIWLAVRMINIRNNIEVNQSIYCGFCFLCVKK